ncbi:MAG: DUF2254 domain-containing protein [Gammaproteobacteria bacterium]
MEDRLKFLLSRIREKLWVKPLIYCILSVLAALLARVADSSAIGLDLEATLPEISRESVEDLLKITAASMLVIATFSVGAMVAAYASAGSTATPRTFSLIISDDVSQNALSTFVGVFIYSVVSLMALMNGYYGKPGRFVLFALTMVALAIVIIKFVRWVDRIARLGRLGTVVDKVEAATAQAMETRLAFPTLRGMRAVDHAPAGTAVYAQQVGYVQQIDVRKLQHHAEQANLRITVAALPGTFATPDRALLHVASDDGSVPSPDHRLIQESFIIGQDRLFDHDPRFGLVVLSEIATRALSPGINDPGTAIDIIGTYVRLFVQWSRPPTQPHEPECNRVYVPELDVGDMFDDAFTAITRDGAAILEVQIRLQKALRTLAFCGNNAMRREAVRHAQLALIKAEKAIAFEPDIELIRAASRYDESHR